MAFLLVPGVHLLDLSGPAQVFSTSAGLGMGYRLHYVAEQPSVTTAQGLVVQAATSWPELGPDDLVLVPGWRGDTLAGSGSIGPESLAVLRAHHCRGGTVA
ncbi:MAG: hypothetical protein QOE32_955, partial [Pseudonocardiales bacterium]|nr:hypothetical protein [Pseudonocardiales bacterium]